MSKYIDIINKGTVHNLKTEYYQNYVDTAQVVRCKDCKHADLFYPYCTIWEAAIDEDGYCYKGEKE